MRVARPLACAAAGRTSRRRCASSSGGATDAGIVDLVRAVSGLETEEAGLELGEVTLDEALAELLRGGEDRHFHPLGDAGGDDAFRCSRSRSAVTAGCACSATSGSARSSPTTWGSARRCRRSRCSLSEREQPGARRVRPDARRLPDERRAAVGRGDRALRALAARPPAPRAASGSPGAELAAAARASDVVVTSYDIATRDVDDSGDGRVGPAAARRGAGREEPGDEACARAAPARRARGGWR